MIPKILSGQKTIESRWYQTKRAPWDQIKKGDTVFFKDSGKKVTIRGQASTVLQFEIKDHEQAQAILDKYGKQIGFTEDQLNIKKWGQTPKYCILIFLEKVQKIEEPFMINKKGFGAPAAWLVVKDIEDIKVNSF
ncbi:MAG: hypothetical protein ABIQ91_03280 [Candidatus Paceibacterota bacterium]